MHESADIPAVATPVDPVAGPPATKPRLGEELPVFCEKCGYSLNGLEPVRCGHCNVLHFACPECGHHQPINTLRPAAQRILGRARAVFLTFGIILRIGFFGIYLFAWCMTSASYRYYYSYSSTRFLDWDDSIGFVFFGLLYGAIGRMLLLRRGNGLFVAIGLAAAEWLAFWVGAYLWSNRSDSASFAVLAATLLPIVPVVATITGALIVWPIWFTLVHLFLPKRTAAFVLDWQRSLSARTEKLTHEA